MVGKITKMHISLGKFSIKSAYLWHTLKWVLTGRWFSAFSAIFGPIFGPKMASESAFFAQKHQKQASESAFFAQKHGFWPNFEGIFHQKSSFFTQISPKSAQISPNLPIFAHFSLILPIFSCFPRISISVEFDPILGILIYEFLKFPKLGIILWKSLFQGFGRISMIFDDFTMFYLVFPKIFTFSLRLNTENWLLFFPHIFLLCFCWTTPGTIDTKLAIFAANETLKIGARAADFWPFCFVFP